MTAPRSPVTGFSHVQFVVSDVAASERWYTQVLGLERLVADEGSGYVALVHRAGRFVVVLTGASTDASGARCDRLDHVAFAVPDGPSLEEWATKLEEWGVDHGGVVDELGKPSLVLTDPDGIRVELVAPPGTFGAPAGGP